MFEKNKSVVIRFILPKSIRRPDAASCFPVGVFGENDGGRIFLPGGVLKPSVMDYWRGFDPWAVWSRIEGCFKTSLDSDSHGAFLLWQLLVELNELQGALWLLELDD